MERKNFITINESFICQNCGENNPKLEKSCRNHCRKCLYSLHVDNKVPGDRKSTCKGLMKPFRADQKNIFHKCIKCGKIIQNKIAPDDNFEKIIELSQPTK